MSKRRQLNRCLERAAKASLELNLESKKLLELAAHFEEAPSLGVQRTDLDSVQLILQLVDEANQNLGFFKSHVARLIEAIEKELSTFEEEEETGTSSLWKLLD